MAGAVAAVHQRCQGRLLKRHCCKLNGERNLTDDDRKHASATIRNGEPIARVLQSVLPASGLVLEVASGTGEHVVYFARQFPSLTWQPSDASRPALRSIAAWTAGEDLQNVLPPLLLDAAANDWPLERADAIVCINMLHISSWAAAAGLMRGAGLVLGPGAPLYIYGPFRRADRPLEESNRAFDLQLRGSNPEWGLRELEEVTACAEEHGLTRDAAVEMPANNLSVVFRKL